MDIRSKILNQLDAAEMDAFDALLLLGGTCRINFTREQLYFPGALKASAGDIASNQLASLIEYGSLEEEDNEESEEDDDFDDDDEEDSEEDETQLKTDSSRPNASSPNSTEMSSLAEKRKSKRSKRLKRKRRRSLTWDRTHIADSCKEAMKRVRAYLHTQKHTPLPSYVVPISDVHSFFGLMYVNILNFGDLNLVMRFFDHFATPRVTCYTYNRTKDDVNEVEKAKIPRVKGGDLNCLYFAYFFETSPDIVSNLKKCSIIPVSIPPSGSGAPNSNSNPSHVGNSTTMSHIQQQQTPLLPVSQDFVHVNTPSTESSTSAEDSMASSITPFALNEYICCVELEIEFQGTRLFEADIRDLKTIIERDNGLVPSTQRPSWTTERIQEYFSTGLRPFADPVPYKFGATVRLYVNNRRKVDRVEFLRASDPSWL